MDTVSIRDLRGADLRQKAKAGEPLAVTNYRVLIGVIIPVSSAWVEHLVVRNWPRIDQSIVEGERALTDTADGQDFLNRLHAVFNPAEATGKPRGTLAGPAAVRPIRIGDLSAARIEKAGAGGETLAITHDRELIGILVPVTQDLVQFLVERNITSVLDHIHYGERELKETGLA
jgi:antitoxin (DNA-binding transcriptional repressor) of toxin-antitoxin stability system